jgi:hypothetical protein
MKEVNISEGGPAIITTSRLSSITIRFPEHTAQSGVRFDDSAALAYP